MPRTAAATFELDVAKRPVNRIETALVRSGGSILTRPVEVATEIVVISCVISMGALLRDINGCRIESELLVLIDH